MREDCLVRDGTATSTWDPVVTDDAHCRGGTVHYSTQGPYHGTPSPWRVYATGEFAEE